MPSYRILLIEDDKVAVMSFLKLASRLEEYQLEVVCADSLLEGMSLAKNESFDLIFSDLGLPDSRSMETIATMSFTPLGKPIAILTSSDEPALAQAARDLRFADYLVKDRFNLETLRAVLRDNLEPNSLTQVA